MAYSDLVVADGATHYYPFSGDGNDAVGSSNFTIATGYTTATSGKHGTALTANSSTKTGSYLPSALYTLFGSTYTIEMWFKYGNSGTSQELMRVQDDVALEMNPDGTILYYYKGDSGSTTPAYNDNAWHHLVITRDSSRNVIVYVDGVSRITFTATTGSPTSGNVYFAGSQYTTQAAISGQMDDVAIYPTALTSTKVGNHYAQADLAYDASILTLSAQTVEPTGVGQVNNITEDVATATVSLSANEAFFGKSVSLLTTGDQRFQDKVTPDGYSYTTAPMSSSGGGDGFAMTYSLPSDYSDAGLISATLSIDLAFSTGTPTAKVRAITAPWAEGDGTVPTLSSGYVSWTIPSGTGAKTVDVTSLVSGAIYGLWVEQDDSSTNFTISTKDGGSPTSPKVLLRYAIVPQTVTYDASTLGITAATVDPSVSTAVAIAADTLTASLLASGVTIEADVSPDVVIDVTALNVALATNDATVAQSILIDATAQTASLAVVSLDSVSVTSNALIDLDTPRVTFTHIQLTDVNGEPILPTEDDDAYFNAVMNLDPYIWYRFNDLTPPPVPRAYQSVADADLDEYAGRLFSTTVGLNGGPNGRKYFQFNGTSRFEQAETYNISGEPTFPRGTLEFSIRTERKDQFLMRFDDMPVTSTDLIRMKDLSLTGGKLKFDWYGSAVVSTGLPFGPRGSVVGRTDIADGNWHHIVVVSDFEGYFDLYIDGRLDFRRQAPPVSFPDFIGGYTSSSIAGYSTAIPADKWFVGDMCEVAFYDYALNPDQIFRLNDTIYGYDPVYVDAARVTLNGDEASAKTNTKRVLTVNLRGSGTLWQKAPGNVDENFGTNAVAFQGLHWDGTDLTHSRNANGFQFFSVNAVFNGSNAPYHDDITDMVRLVDLDIDVDLDDFDILTFVNYPTTGADWDFLNNAYSDWNRRFGGPTPEQQIENMMRQAQQFAINGGGLMVTDPMVAQAIGMIDHYEFVDQLQEKREFGFDYGLSFGDNDLRASEINPWGSSPNGPSTTIWNPRSTGYPVPGVNYNYLAHFYRDEHSNTWQTVRTLIDGLTDIPGRILTDAIDFDPYSDTGQMWAERWDKRDDGLSVGDTFKILGTRGSGYGDPLATAGIGASLTMRVFGQIAAPIANLKSGVVVTSFAPTYWNKDVATPNPYKDYVVSAVVRPGDLLNGEVVQGRIYMNFSEGYNDMAPYMRHAIVQQVPADADLPPVYTETAESRLWTVSTWRGGWASSGGGGTDTGSVLVDSNGNTIFVPGKKDVTTGITYNSRWPSVYEEAPQMAYRGLLWVGSGIDEEGNATVGLESATMSVTANEATVQVQQSVDITVPTLRFNVEAHTDADTVSHDVEVLLTTADMALSIGAFREVIDLTTATMTLQSVDDADGVLAGTDLVVLILPDTTVTLILEER